jgi:tetratricopeptide (TPR) repeat protein
MASDRQIERPPSPEFVNRLRKALNALDKPQNWLARHIKVTDAAVSRWVQNGKLPGERRLVESIERTLLEEAQRRQIRLELKEGDLVALWDAARVTGLRPFREKLGDPESSVHVSSGDLFHLPRNINDFTGRREELERVRGLLHPRDQTRSTAVVGIVGKPGVGKTALAVRAAHELSSEFPDGQLYADLRGFHEHPAAPSYVLAEFLRALGVKGGALLDPSRVEDRARLYRARLAGRRILVVLDNAADAKQVHHLLPGSSTCGAIITSRRSLVGLEGVTIEALDVFSREEAVELLAKLEGYNRVSTEQQVAEEIVRLFGYLPLAVRIAGGLLRVRPRWSLESFLGRLRRERGRLGPGVLFPEVRASFMLSYNRLDNDEQRLFDALGLLEAVDFTAFIAAALRELSVEDAEVLLDALLDAQLVETARSAASGQPRYRIHDLLRTFARERLIGSEAETAQRAAHDRVLHAYLAVAQAAANRLTPGALPEIEERPAQSWRGTMSSLAEAEVDDPRVWFTVERDHMIANVRRAHQLEFWELTWKLAATLTDFFELRARWYAWQETHELALDAARRIGDRRGEASTLRRLARLYLERDEWDKAISTFDESLKIFQELGDRLCEARVRRGLGRAYRDQGRLDAAATYFERALPVFVELGDRRWEAATLRSLGPTYRDMGRSLEAIDSLQRSLEMFRDLGDRHCEARVLRNLGDIYRDEGRQDIAVEYFYNCREIFRELGDLRWEARVIRSLGGVYYEQGDLERAVQYFEKARDILHKFGDRHGEARAICGLGDVQRNLGDLDGAIAYHRQSLSLFHVLGDLRWQARTLQVVGEIYLAIGNHEEATNCLGQALGMFRKVGDEKAAARIAEDLSDLHGAQGPGVL